MYFNKLKAYWDEHNSLAPLPKCSCTACTCDVAKEFLALREKDHLYDFLMGLDDAYATIKTQILSMTPLPRLRVAYHLVAEDEQQKLISASSLSNVKAAAFHVQNDCRRDRPRCTHCNKLGHIQEKCFKLIGYPSDWKKPNRDRDRRDRHDRNDRQDRRNAPKAALVSSDTSPVPRFSLSQYNILMKTLNLKPDDCSEELVKPAANLTGMAINKALWVLDTRASVHMTNTDSHLLQLRQSFSPPVTIPNGQSVLVKGVGNIILSPKMAINDVLYIPEFKCSLFSVSKFTNDYNCAVTFLAKFCFIQDLSSRTVIGVGECKDGLYFLTPCQPEGVAFAVQGSASRDLWHSRLGHASFNKLKQLSFCSHLFNQSTEHFCDSCIRAKQTRFPFGTNEIKSVSCFDLIHCDIWGGYKTPSLDGDHYFLTIVDDYSRGLWVYLMKQKSETSRYLQSFILMIKTQFGKMVK